MSGISKRRDFSSPPTILTLWSKSAPSQHHLHADQTLSPSSAFSIPNRAASFRSCSKSASLCGVHNRNGVGRLVDSGDRFNAESNEANSSPLGNFNHGGVSLPNGVWSRESRCRSVRTGYACSWNAGLPGCPVRYTGSSRGVSPVSGAWRVDPAGPSTEGRYCCCGCGWLGELSCGVAACAESARYWLDRAAVELDGGSVSTISGKGMLEVAPWRVRWCRSCSSLREKLSPHIRHRNGRSFVSRETSLARQFLLKNSSDGAQDARLLTWRFRCSDRLKLRPQ